MNFKEAQTVKTILKKNNKVGGLILAEFKICYKATVIQIVWYCTGLDIWIKEPKWKLQIHPYIYGQLTFDNSVKVIQWKKHSPSNKWCQDTWISTCKRMKLNPYLTPYTKINPKWIKDLNVRVKTLKLLQDNIGANLHETGFGKVFLDMTPKAWAK